MTILDLRLQESVICLKNFFFGFRFIPSSLSPIFCNYFQCTDRSSNIFIDIVIFSISGKCKSKFPRSLQRSSEKTSNVGRQRTESTEQTS